MAINGPLLLQIAIKFEFPGSVVPKANARNWKPSFSISTARDLGDCVPPALLKKTLGSSESKYN